MNPTQANRAYLKMKRKLMERMGYSSIDIPTLRNVHPEFMYAKQRLINATKEETSMTLRELKPSSYSAINVTVEYLGRRYLITHCNDWFTAERVACDYQAKFPNACYFTSSKYDSTHIDGKAIDFRNHYAKELLA
tara:strand:+ start:248 stop:652 length:405 start_codon:yes stop_codon:yes gene_type:complete